MKRLVLASIAVLIAFGTLAGCQRTVSVQTGVRIECPYGHVVEENLKTVEVPAKNASAYRLRTEKRVCDQHAKLEALYAEAQAALTNGDVKLAEARLTQITTIDPTFRKTSEQLAAIKSGKKPEPDDDPAPTGGSGTTTAPSGSTTATVDPSKPGEGDTSSPIGAFAKYVPDTLAGFTARPLVTEPLAITRDYEADAGSKARRLVIVAEQLRTAKEAKAGLEKQMGYYTKSASTETAGKREVRFGSDGRSYVSVGFTDGAVLVILELSAADGVDPIKLKSTVLAAAAELP